ncbi:MAG: glycosyltransferase [Lachnospiraceae bacterium]|nr:glycosyltransferase [Lachnospiraceae bacterium]
MKVSVIVPVYNLREHLSKCLESLAAQTYSDLEIILVDDGSVDGSGDICDEYAHDHEDARVVHKTNGGLVSAWKAGVEAATGTYVMFVDGDDWIDPGMVEAMAAHVTGSEGEVICSDYVIERRLKSGNGSSYIKTSECVYQTLAPGEYDRAFIEEKIVPDLLGNEKRPIHFSRCMKLIDIKLVKDNMRYADEAVKMGEDSLIMIPVLLDAQRICVLDHKAFYHYELVGSSMIHRYDPACFDNLKRLISGFKKILNDKFGDSGEKYALMLRKLDAEIVVMMLYVLKNELRNPAADYKDRVKAVSTNKDIADTVRRTEVTFSAKQNRLLYALLKKPTRFRIFLLRTLMNMNDARY